MVMYDNEFKTKESCQKSHLIGLQLFDHMHNDCETI